MIVNLPPREARTHIQFVTGYWPVIGNTKRSTTFYSEMFPRTLSFLGGPRPKLFVTDQTTLEFLEADKLGYLESEVFRMDTKSLVPDLLVQRVRENSVRNSRRSVLLASLRPKRDKHRTHFLSHLTRMGVRSYTELVVTWLAKIYAMKFLLENSEIDDSKFLGWADIGLARIWTGPLASKIADSTAWPLLEEGFSHIRPRMTEGCQNLALSAGLLVAKPPAWRRLFPQFESIAMDAYTEAFLHDEETILSRTTRQKDIPFRTIYGWDRHK